MLNRNRRPCFHCGSQVDARGLHGLTCKLAPGRIARHQTPNDVVTRALVSAGIPATKEPVGLLRSDGKRPDGLTLVPWQSGKPLTWDVTVDDDDSVGWLGGLLVERRTSVSQIRGSIPGQVAAV